MLDHRYLLVAGMVLFLLTMVRVETTEATALGLANGSYTVTIDFQQGGPNFDATGTMTIGDTGITEFHVSLPNSVPDSFDCDVGACAVGSSTPDTVETNGAATSEFDINDAGLDLTLQLLTDGTAHFLDDGDNTNNGTWTAVAVPTGSVPEPLSLTLLLAGISVLGLRARMRCRGN
jgi:PEP-CTERM motif-containing protein